MFALRWLWFRRVPAFIVLALQLCLGGCSHFDFQPGLTRANDATRALTQTDWQLARTDAQKLQRQELARQLLSQPIGSAQAVQLMLANSPAFQALLAQYWIEAADAAQAGRIANPVFSLERVVTGSERELQRYLSVGLLDLLTWPQRGVLATQRIEQAQLKLASEVIDRVTRVRQAWVEAVAARQTLQYAQQVMDSAQASAELARRMEVAGNFNRLTRARQQAFLADAATRMASAQHDSLVRREELIRWLGLDDMQASELVLPDRLPAVPEQPLADAEVTQAAQQASGQRLDVQLARANYNAAALAQGLTAITSVTDIEYSVRRGRIADAANGSNAASRGDQIGVRLPLFDSGDLRRDAMNAQTLAAANQLESTLRQSVSSLRESHAAYQSAHELSRRYKEEILPWRQVMADENLLRYNAMQIGVFELLADARDQLAAVLASIQADRQFWLAEVALQANLIGRPMGAPTLSGAVGASTPASPGH